MAEDRFRFRPASEIAAFCCKNLTVPFCRSDKVQRVENERPRPLEKQHVMCLQSAVNSFGADVIAGITAANRVENLTNIPLSGLGVATQTFVAQNYGAKKYDRILDSVKKILILDISLSIIMSLIARCKMKLK